MRIQTTYKFCGCPLKYVKHTTKLDGQGLRIFWVIDMIVMNIDLSTQHLYALNYNDEHILHETFVTKDKYDIITIFKTEKRCISSFSISIIMYHLSCTHPS